MTAFLVGTGPGDPKLMTARSLELIAHADVIIHDRLIPESALDGARSDAIVIDAGKRAGSHRVDQSEINGLLCHYGTRGLDVVRLKGGDPFIFGRGGEEAQALDAAGVDYEIVPGVTAAFAAGAYAGIPLTQRGVASAVAFLTGHEDPDTPQGSIDWRAVAAFPGTLVVYMGVRHLRRIAELLIAGGRHEHEPAAIVQRATWAEQHTVRGTLATLADLAESEGIEAPAVCIFGPVAALHDQLAWFSEEQAAACTAA
jgi:uroporphyrinogen III methyltransferase / synthase